MQSKADTVEQYLAELPEDRRAALQAIREVVLKNMSSELQEQMQYGMIGYVVPHSIFPQGYHCDPKQPLNYLGLASQKNHMSIYLCSIYLDEEEQEWFRNAWTRAGKKLDMGKACIRFKKIEDVPLEVLAETIRRYPAQRYIDSYLQVLNSRKK